MAQQIDLGQFIAAIIDVQGGEVRIPYDAFTTQTGDKMLTIDFEDDGATIVLRLIDAVEVPDDVE